MKIDDRAPQAPHDSSHNPAHPALGKPGPLGALFQYLVAGGDTVLVSPAKSQPSTTKPADEVVTEYTAGFHTCMFQGVGLTPEYITNFSIGTELNMARADAP